MDLTALTMKSIALLVAWVFAPTVMLGSVLLARAAAERPLRREDRASARAGWWAGLMLFALYFLYRFPAFEVPTLFQTPHIELNLIGVGAGLLMGVLILYGLERLVETRLMPALVLVLSFAGAAAWYNYVFVRTYNEVLLSACLGIALGLLLRVVIYPRSRHTLAVVRF